MRPTSGNPFLLQTTQTVSAFSTPNIGKAYIVNNTIFPALDGVTCYTLEVWEEAMRLPHWHPNASELGFVISGELEIIIWRSPGETAVFTLTAGMCWFIPKAALHSLNNIGNSKARLLVGFSVSEPQDIDLPVAFNGIPIPIRNAYTAPHSELSKWQGVIDNPLLGKLSFPESVKDTLLASPYGFDFSKVTPLFNDAAIGNVKWGVKSNWGILEEISVIRVVLKPRVSRDPIWYPDAGTLYVVSEGEGEFNIIIANSATSTFQVKLYDYIYVPQGVLHTFTNNGTSDFKLTGFFTRSDPLPEVSLAVATSFFPKSLIKLALTQYGTESKTDDPLQNMNETFTSSNPYLIKLSDK